jgi:hypothetical protein
MNALFNRLRDLPNWRSGAAAPQEQVPQQNGLDALMQQRAAGDKELGQLSEKEMAYYYALMNSGRNQPSPRPGMGQHRNALGSAGKMHPRYLLEYVRQKLAGATGQ